ncbi:hypothetical protein MADA3029_740060 [Vibrio nigripulchritudo MADA3029]|uniref:hypothetical protein n=1 Tax=Vibrio nigripulchritudo TaxID=28173 RepID=UPI0003B1ED48|nr:hypothetical protein [Vibrio nigripulchritudo]CCN46015.1 hypothetical protein VIBNIMADA3020_1180045 [Vibrio nigripulchritudo MADA3020]CCN54139.1 hypothetical protein VIBNIMADA3021_510062 [Vibrio nigripulchritudo MADA3021]CCN61209.1 hypothetical protein MADA3029_740060 [Vibrio nigripulchritudo MADA3029]
MSENIYKEAEKKLLEEKFNKLSADERHFIVEKVLSSKVNIREYYKYLNDFEKFEKSIVRLVAEKEEKQKEATLHKSAQKLQATMTEQGFEVSFEDALKSIMSLTAGKKGTETKTKSPKSNENKKFDLDIGGTKFENKGMGGQGDQSAILEAIQKVNANHTLNDKWMYVVADHQERLVSLVESGSITLKDKDGKKLSADVVRSHFKIEKTEEVAE